MALRLAGHGCPVAIVDQDADGLESTAAMIGGPMLVRTLDVRDRQAQFAFAAEVAEWAPAPLGIVFNNAGVATSQSVAEGAVEDDEWVISVNFGGVVNGTRAFLPILLAQNSGLIVNTSSVFGLLGMPFQSAYCASKFAVRGFTDSLRQELRRTGVRAATIHPGGVKTNIVRNARFHPTRCRPTRRRNRPRRCSTRSRARRRSARPRSSTTDAGRARVGFWSALTPTRSMPWLG